LTAVTDLARLISLAHFLRDELDALFRSYFVYWLCLCSHQNYGAIIPMHF